MTSTSTGTNPATGLPMVGGNGGLDVGGNPYGVDWQKNEFFNPISHTSFDFDMGAGFNHDYLD